VRSDLGLLHKLYAGLLMLYPKAFREDYGQELQSVFDLSVEDAAEKGGLEVEKLVLHELFSLPKAVFLAHLRERRKIVMNRSFNSYFEFASGSWREFLTALLPFFLVGGVTPLLDYLGKTGLVTNAARTVIMLALFGLVLIFLAIGVKKGMPRWSMPYLGFLFAILSVYLFSMVFGTPIYFIFRSVRDESILFIDVLWDGIFWYGLLTTLIVLVILTRSYSAFQHFRNDWTQLNFILYGAVPFALWFSFDEYIGEEPYLFLVFLILAIGAWIYLQSTKEWTRFAVLFIGLTLAIVIATVAKVVLIPSQSWSTTPYTGLTTSDAKHAIIMWGWFALGMLIPLGIKFRPRSTNPAEIAPSKG
jgi:hypothetical protein